MFESEQQDLLKCLKTCIESENHAIIYENNDLIKINLQRNIKIRTMV